MKPLRATLMYINAWRHGAGEDDLSGCAGARPNDDVSTTPMPYARNDDLPLTLRAHLPPHAQDIFRQAFNHAWETYGAREPSRREEIAHRVAWAAVKRRYCKDGPDWVPLDG